MGEALQCDASYAHAVDRPPVRRAEVRPSRESHRLSQGDGRSWPLWRAVSEVWRQGSADSLCRQGDELLCSLSDGRQSSCRSQFVSTLGIGLAAHARGTGGSQAPLTQPEMFPNAKDASPLEFSGWT